MLITDYLVGRDTEGGCLTLVVNEAFLTECSAGRAILVRRIDRVDLIQEFVEDDAPVDCILLPDLPLDVVSLLESGATIRIIDQADNAYIDCCVPAEQQVSYV